MQLPTEIFKAYDIRGIVGKTLTPEIVYAIGQALGSLSIERGAPTISVGRDGRLSGPELSQALRDGIVSTGCNAIDLGLVPSPVSYFAGHALGTGSCISVTGSHNPPDYNGIKMVIAGEAIWGETILSLKSRAESGDVLKGTGTHSAVDVKDAYFHRVVGDAKMARPMKIAIDCGNGAVGELAPKIFRAMGCDVVEMEIDRDTWEVRPIKVTAVQEFGRPIHPNLARGQIEGGTAQAMGFALLEKVVMKDGAMANAQLTNYVIPTTLDTPEYDIVMLENRYEGGPFGAKGLGELPMDGPAPAVVNAIRHFGLDLREVPATPEIIAACASR